MSNQFIFVTMVKTVSCQLESAHSRTYKHTYSSSCVHLFVYLGNFVKLSTRWWINKINRFIPRDSFNNLWIYIFCYVVLYWKFVCTNNLAHIFAYYLIYFSYCSADVMLLMYVCVHYCSVIFITYFKLHVHLFRKLLFSNSLAEKKFIKWPNS